MQLVVLDLNVSWKLNQIYLFMIISCEAYVNKAVMHTIKPLKPKKLFVLLAFMALKAKNIPKELSTIESM